MFYGRTRGTIVRLLAVSTLLIGGSFPVWSNTHQLRGVQSKPESPKLWLDQQTTATLSTLSAHQQEFDHNPARLLRYIAGIVPQYWDIPRMTRALVGANWRGLSHTKKQTLEHEWSRTLQRYFVRAYPYFSGQSLVLDNSQLCPSPRRCRLRTHVAVAGKGDIKLDFFLHYSWQPNIYANTNAGTKAGAPARTRQWRLVDIQVAGVSLMRHKKGESRSVIEKSGIDGLITALKAKNDQVLGAAPVVGNASASIAVQHATGPVRSLQVTH